jgi:hypothetical protein
LDKKVYFFNPNTTTAIGSASFVASNDTSHSLVTSINYNKGNVNNGPINWSTTNLSPVSNVATLNGYTASFNLVKDRNVSMVSLPQITGSRFATFNNEYAFNFTSSLTASIQAAATGSVTMSLQIPEAGIITSSKIFSATSAGVNIITASFDTRNELPYNITASVIFNKGNISNVPNNWRNIAKSDSQDLLTDGTFINGNSSSFNIIKDKDVSVIAIPYASQSNSGTFQNNYAFNITSSLTASILPNTTGSVTMSLEIPETGFYTSSKFFNSTSAGNKILSASFVSTTASSSFNITASIINNKGNISNTPINWLVTGSGKFIGVLESSSFNIKKDVNTTMVTASFTASISSSYLNDYAFNQTASISSSFIPYYTSGSASLYVAKANIIVPEASIDDTLWISSSAELGMKTLTSSFAAQTISKYSVTGSIITYEIPAVDYLIVGGGGGSGARVRTDDNTGLPAENSYIAGGGAGGLLSGSLILTSSRTYPITIGFGGLTAPGTGINTRSSNGGNSTVFDFTSIGGGYGGFIDKGDNRIPPTEVLGGNGGSGGGYGPSNGVAGQGNNGLGSGYLIGAGAGSSSGSVATWLDGNTYAGGGGGWRYPTYATFITASNNTGSFGGGGTAISNGQGGIATSGSAGVVKLRYSSSIALATGGEITSASGYIYHTFTSASLAATSGTGSFTFYGLVPV